MGYYNVKKLRKKEKRRVKTKIMEYFSIWYLLILASFSFILFNYMYFSCREDKLNNFFGFMTLLFVFLHIIFILLLSNQEITLQVFVIPLWILTLGLPLVVIISLLMISTGIAVIYKRFFRTNYSKLHRKINNNKIRSKVREDTLRKGNHIIIFTGVLIVWYIGLLVMRELTGSSDYMLPEGSNMFLLYLRILNEPNSIENIIASLGWLYFILFFFFYTLSLFIITIEFSRKSKFFSFPFNIFPKLYLSENERERYGTYLYFSIGQMLSAFICPPMVFFAILGTGSYGDLMASQIGIRYGKKHISWNEKKTWEGTIAGIIMTFFICILFIGMIWAIIFAMIFLIVDIFTEKPINISDNLLIPIGCSLSYIIIRFIFNFNYYSIILSWL